MNTMSTNNSEKKQTINLTIESSLLDLVDEQIKENLNYFVVGRGPNEAQQGKWIIEAIRHRLTEIKREDHRPSLVVEMRTWDENPIPDLRITITPEKKGSGVVSDIRFGAVYCNETYSQTTTEYGMAWFALPDVTPFSWTV